MTIISNIYKTEIRIKFEESENYYKKEDFDKTYNYLKDSGIEFEEDKTWYDELRGTIIAYVLNINATELLKRIERLFFPTNTYKAIYEDGCATYQCEHIKNGPKEVAIIRLTDIVSPDDSIKNKEELAKKLKRF